MENEIYATEDNYSREADIKRCYELCEKLIW